MYKEFEFYSIPFKINKSLKVNIPVKIVKEAKLIYKEKDREGKVYRFILMIEED